MRISKEENTALHKVLFEDLANYDKWAPDFYKEFVRENSKGILAGVMGLDFVNVNDVYDEKFKEYLKVKGIEY